MSATSESIWICFKNDVGMAYNIKTYQVSPTHSERNDFQ